MSENFQQSSGAPPLSSFGVLRQIRCDFQDCAQAAILRLDLHLFCLDHLISHCHQRLEACQAEICRNVMPADDTVESNNCFLEECTSRLAGFLMARPELQNIDRARVLDVMLWAAELDGKYGRSASGCRVVAKRAGIS